MFDLVRKLIVSREEAREVKEADREMRTSIAACVVLLEAASADYECTDEELSHVVDTIKTIFDLSHEYAEELVEISREERAKAVDLWRFTNQINKSFTREEKINVMEAVWRIVHADGQIEKYEDCFTRKLTNLLRLSHKDMIDAKLKAKAGL
jgi:uncharacterized tellurite resistance protein B-like protein